jgi:hypothetical protein
VTAADRHLRASTDAVVIASAVADQRSEPVWRPQVGSVVVDVPVASAAASIIITPDAGSVDRLPEASQQFSFKVKNTGNAAGTYFVAAACSGIGIAVESCNLPLASTISLNPGDSTYVPVTFNTLARGSTGSVVLRGHLISDSSVRDTGYTGVFVLRTPLVTPDTLKVRVASAAVVDTFKVQNTATNSRTFNFTAVCTWADAPLSCARAPASATLAPGAIANVTVGYTTGGLSSSGRITLRAVQNNSSVFRDSSTITAATHSKPSFVNGGRTEAGVRPMAPTALPVAVRNPGRISATFNLVAACAGEGIPSATCTVVPPSLTIVPGGTGTAQVGFQPGRSGAAGRIRVVATNASAGTAKDSATIGIRTAQVRLSLSSRASAANRAPNSDGKATVWIRNDGQEWDDVVVSASCSGAVFAGPCVREQRVSIAPAESAQVWIDYRTKSAGTTGVIAFSARSVNDSTVGDSSIAHVSVPAAIPVMGVLVLGAAQYQALAVGAGTRFADFETRNLGNGLQDWYWVKVKCSGSAIVTGSCRAGPGTSSENDSVGFVASAGAYNPRAVQFQSTGAQGTTGFVSLMMENYYDRSIRDSALVSVFCCITNHTAVSARPDRGLRVRQTGVLYVDTLTVTNRGSGTTSFGLTAPCPVTFLPGSCILSQSTVTLSSLQSANVTYTYATKDSVSRSTVPVFATDSQFITTIDAATFDVLVTKDTTATVAVAPDGASARRPLNTTGLVDSFIVTNTGLHRDSIALSVTCGAPTIVQGSCALSPSGTLTLGPSMSSYVAVTYSTAAAGGRGTITLRATSKTNPTASDEPPRVSWRLG